MIMKKRKKSIIIVVSGFLICIAVFIVVFRPTYPFVYKYPVRGVDVSHYQGDIDWSVLAAENIQFSFIKATEGSSSVDERFAENWAGAGDAGLKIGAYHFFSFDSQGLTQAENFISHVKKEEGMLPPVVDVEFYGDKENNPPAASDIQPELQSFLDKLEEYYGVRPIIYTTMKAYNCYIKDNFDTYPLWIRNIIREPGNELNHQWIFWQYTGSGKLNGYRGEEPCIDLNVFHGNEEDFGRWSSGL